MLTNDLFNLAGAGLMLLGLSGCAIGWTDKEGVRHLVGLVDASIRPSDGQRLAGDILEVSTFGASLLMERDATSLTGGYNRSTAASFRDNALARGPFDRVTVENAPETKK